MKKQLKDAARCCGGLCELCSCNKTRMAYQDCIREAAKTALDDWGRMNADFCKEYGIILAQQANWIQSNPLRCNQFEEIGGGK